MVERAIAAFAADRRKVFVIGLSAGGAQGIISVAYLMDARNPQWMDDPGMKAFDEFLARDFPEGNPADSMVMTGFKCLRSWFRC
jgi:hypothetical protein